MTPDTHRIAGQLEEQHRKLQAELRAWKTTTAIDVDRLVPQTAGVPAVAFNVFRAACIAHVEAAIAANRKRFEEL